MEKKN
jgi:hypothetical protein